MEIEKESDALGCLVLIEEFCQTKRTFIVHAPTPSENSTEAWLLAYQHLNFNKFSIPQLTSFKSGLVVGGLITISHLPVFLVSQCPSSTPALTQPFCTPPHGINSVAFLYKSALDQNNFYFLCHRFHIFRRIFAFRSYFPIQNSSPICLCLSFHNHTASVPSITKTKGQPLSGRPTQELPINSTLVLF